MFGSNIVLLLVIILFVSSSKFINLLILLPFLNLELNSLFHLLVSLEENDKLCAIPIKKEIRDVIWYMSHLKSPDLEGMPAKFYKDYWDIVGQSVIHFVQ